MDDDAAIAEQILRRFRRVAVVGISADASRPSHEVASYLRGAGYEILPVNPTLPTWEGLPCWPDLRAVPPPVEVVDIFRRSEQAGAVVDEAIAIGARAVWMQLGVIDTAAAARARAAGLLVVMDRCMLREHRRLAP
ncbi:MAG TPA: CoA-binding protein [Candidatus Dormibacteraeota bacterium]|nr:CoA-binding protein [Candidatus Dormibacteraeota bacterium]